jgi:hypothetical protein
MFKNAFAFLNRFEFATQTLCIDCLYIPILADVYTAMLNELLIADVVGSSGLEPPTLRLSGARSNRLSYEPMLRAVE